MAQIGLKYLICAPLTEASGGATHADGIVMAHAIKVDLSVDLNEAILSADDRRVEHIKEFKAGKLVLNGDHLEYKTLALILGHEVTTDADGVEILTARGSDDGDYVGVGFYATTVKSGDRKYRAVWLQKVKFGIPGESLETKGDGGIKFQTPTIEGAILTDVGGVWKREGIFETEEDAVKWLNNKAGIPFLAPKETDDGGVDNG